MTHIPKIIIKIIAPENQRLTECGDWFYDTQDDTLTIFVSMMSDWRSELAVAIHELYEAVAFLANGGDQTDVDFFDKGFYQEHEEGEAGDDPKAPYFKEHKEATFVEQEVCSRLNLTWEKHELNIEDA